ncbi:uncharacterized protein BO95DRAFT_457487 [Aspergillus brunneoviolaceus CBS 621.78]|uniref:Uncharacterized protein n=1 Tax=Aspergillus brunneoviolaceus CBS 621.78 TaxID=1450534 RepID=A0ACD1FTJ5_9EURO|nr:hypothetical protein BO95DRAFT_457487 [Aspergillus brunneoviolaceus CBS 621.78]RAH40310.1 hypothetical protein BO95DRAFT_457487 [Aspergillus brunneoviolaceus CBS 621.78]
MALAAPPRGVIPGDLLLVVHDFDARGPDELTLRRGEKIELVELDEGFGDGWYLGKDLTTGSTGLFPGVYTTAAPKIRSRPPAESTAHTTSEHSTDTDGAALDAEPLLRSGESTPQVSRHTSISDLRAPEVPRSPPQQQQPQQRSASSPLPAAKMSLEIRQALEGQHRNGQDSPVMNETLSVIDEHITDLSTPRHSVADREPSVLNDSASEYSSHLDHRRSYINGHETDEEEERQPQEAQVRRWSPAYTARQLRQLGIEDKHCDIFEEQEISGEVLLDMNQDFLFMKEFDFGVMGRRLKTWHKIRTFQDQVKVAHKQPSPAVSPTLPRSSLAAVPGSPERTRSRTGQTAPLLPRIPTLRTSNTPHPRLVSNAVPSTSSGSPIPSQSSSFMDHSRRPSAASVREINHSRRHSSIDATTRYSGVVDGSPGPTQRGSFDRAWSLSTGPQQRLPTRPGTSAGTSTGTSPALETGLSNGSDTAGATPDDLDRGYFSGPEGDTRKQRRLADARISPVPGEPLRVAKRHSQKATQPIAPPNNLSTRLVERRTPQSAPVSAIEDRSGGSSLFGPLFGGKSESDTPRSSQQSTKIGGPKFPMSDVVSKNVDTTAAPPSPVQDRDPAPPRTGSTTPSTTKSSERLSTDGSGKATEGGLWPRSRPSKDTSAYMRGLEKKSPQEQMAGCDYSPNLITTWKPRLFVLRDTEERGLIDITAHRVLRADHDPMVALHATITGSTGSPTAPAPSVQLADGTSSSDPIPSIEAPRASKSGSEGPFFFKLVPPKSGSSRTVQFTKPAVHYFQVDNVQEGRRWMAALMKATIERDMDLPVETTNKQRTISLKEAQLMNQRPPALMVGAAAGAQEGAAPEAMDKEDASLNASSETTDAETAAESFETPEERGLMIKGLDLDGEPASSDGNEDGSRLSKPLEVDTGPASLLPDSIQSSHLYLYLYPVVHGCAFPLPQHDSHSFSDAFLATVRQHMPIDAEPAPAAPFRLLVLADPQLEGDSSLPKAEDELPARLRLHWGQIWAALTSPALPLNSSSATDAESTSDSTSSNASESDPKPILNPDLNTRANQSTLFKINLPATQQAITSALHSLLRTDLPRTLKAARKRLDLLGNDYYLAHIYRTLHWWTQPTHVTVLGDLIGSQWRRGHRYWERVFQGGVRGDSFIPSSAPPADTDDDDDDFALNPTTQPSRWTNRLLNIVGNHDIGYAGDASAARIARFEETFGKVNWDVKFWLNTSSSSTSTSASNHDATPQIHIINLNSLTLDTPAHSRDIQSASYDYLNALIADRLAPVTDRSTFTLLLTHLPLHKRAGVCVDAPHFKFFEEDDDPPTGEEKRWFAGGLREQNHLSEWGVFGMSGDGAVEGGGWGRKGLVLTGHDHEGCDVLHFVRWDADPEQRDWQWDAKRYSSAQEAATTTSTSTPSIREVTMRSMMGAYGGYAGLLSVWFDVDKQEWEYEIQMCAAGVQHIWWAVHVVDLQPAEIPETLGSSHNRTYNTSVVLEVEVDTISAAPGLALADDDGGHDLLTELRLSLLDGGHDHVTDTGSGETVQASTDTLDGDDVKVAGTGVVAAVHHGATVCDC